MNGIIISFIALLAGSCFYLLSSQNQSPKKAIWSVYAILLAVTAALFFYKIVFTISHAGFWDFGCFYLYGKVSSLGENFYSPQNFHTVFNSLQLPAFLNSSNEAYAGFIRECVNIGFPYPPPTILYFIPLGFLSFHTALIVWTLFISSFAFGCIYLIYSLFLKEYKLNGLMLVSILLFTLPQTRGTIFYTQTNFILLFLLLLMKKYADKKWSGLFLAIAFFTKPYMLIFLLYFIIRKNWNSILFFIIGSSALSGLVLILFGVAPFRSYLFDNPAGRYPKEAFLEKINQSLHSILLRNHLISFDNPKSFVYISMALLLLTGIFLLYLLRMKLYNNIFSILLLIGLILYPGTLDHYGLLLLFIIVQFFESKNSLNLRPVVSIITIGVFYLLISYSLFATICCLAILVVYKSFKPGFDFNTLVLTRPDIIKQ